MLPGERGELLERQSYVNSVTRYGLEIFFLSLNLSMGRGLVTNANGTGAGVDRSGKGFDGNEHFNYKARIVSGGTVAPRPTVPW